MDPRVFVAGVEEINVPCFKINKHLRDFYLHFESVTTKYIDILEISDIDREIIKND